MHTKHALIVASATICLIAAALAGPLAPPAGPVAPTHKTLTEVEPRVAINEANTPSSATAKFRISQSGSYVLTGNIHVDEAKHAIEVAASNVTIDLNGFTISGAPASLRAVNVSGSLVNVTVMNGSIYGMGSGGVIMDPSALNCRVNRLSVYVCVGDGISVGTNANVTECLVRGCFSNGIVANSSTVIADCTASMNAFTGIRAGGNATVRSCTAAQNSMGGILTGNVGTVTDCTAASNGQFGISAGTNTLVSNCSVTVTQSTGSAAINLAPNASAVNCNVYGNNGSGIVAGAGASVIDTQVNNNSEHGITAAANVLIRGCSVFETGQDGIRITNSGCRVEGNTVTNAVGVGIRATTSGSFISRNTARGNATNYNIAVGNICLVISATPNAAAIVGNSGGNSPGSPDPNVNFAF